MVICENAVFDFLVGFIFKGLQYTNPQPIAYQPFIEVVYYKHKYMLAVQFSVVTDAFWDVLKIHTHIHVCIYVLLNAMV